jgi:hypothetical protein
MFLDSVLPASVYLRTRDRERAHARTHAHTHKYIYIYIYIYSPIYDDAMWVAAQRVGHQNSRLLTQSLVGFRLH